MGKKLKRRSRHCVALVVLLCVVGSGGQVGAASFSEVNKFLAQHGPTITLRSGAAAVVVSSAWQGRVLTSTVDAKAGASLGWINKALIASGKASPHMNTIGGEDRIWLGPEGGQFSIFFRKDAPFDLDHWYTPNAFDTEPFSLVSRRSDQVKMTKRFSIVNYSGTAFQGEISRSVSIIGPKKLWAALHMPRQEGLSAVAYQTENTLTNSGKIAWEKATGLLSIWILGQFQPSPRAVIVIPLRPETGENDTGSGVTSNYFGPVSSARLRATASAVFLKADGQFRSKIGVGPRRSKGILGAYDPDNHVLTVVTFDQPADVADYVNSSWKIQRDPYSGDVENAYNDGPLTPGGAPLGPFFELESSSPAAALPPGASIRHVRKTFHFVGTRRQLDAMARTVLGVPLTTIESAFQ